MKSFIDWAEENDLDLNEGLFDNMGQMLGRRARGYQQYSSDQGQQQLATQKKHLQNLQQSIASQKQNLSNGMKHLDKLDRELRNITGQLFK